MMLHEAGSTETRREKLKLERVKDTCNAEKTARKQAGPNKGKL